MNVNTEILKLWQSRGENEYTSSDAEKVADIAWEQGLRLPPQRNNHHDKVKYLIGQRNIG
ncbi:hypothetical protein QT13_15100 [Pectobacterium brasiliense]|uniref:hypothetical protein n=1 Tax=Pectobacterium brasiliense TaxID=180957 RepID=UPI00057CF0A4|nr:hypothetical protein [Pectobacterium brasiliense]KHS67117.1 hypothetical protein QT13_15100 [Pectobacterium brasiliense]